jgi:3-oxoacyl-[acyl-carrier protein] reductase
VTNGLLAGDTALITGAAGYIGATIARALAREGAQIFLTDIVAPELKSIADRLADSGAKTAFMAADLKNLASCDGIIEGANERFGTVSILVHAACPRTPPSVLDLSDDNWNEMLSVNLRSGYRMASQLGKTMSAKHVKGRMLFITSLHAQTPRGNPAYSAAKAGMTLMMQELAKALGPHGIRVNAIAPGTISPNYYPNAEPTRRATPLRRLGNAEDIAGMAIALLADQFSSFVTGTTITVDGGLSLYNWLDP